MSNRSNNNVRRTALKISEFISNRVLCVSVCGTPKHTANMLRDLTFSHRCIWMLTSSDVTPPFCPLHWTIVHRIFPMKVYVIRYFTQEISFKHIKQILKCVLYKTIWSTPWWRDYKFCNIYRFHCCECVNEIFCAFFWLIIVDCCRSSEIFGHICSSWTTWLWRWR